MSRRRGGLFGYWPSVFLLGLFLLLTSSFVGVAQAALGAISLTLTTYGHDGLPGAGTVDFGDVYPDTPFTVSPAMVASVASGMRWRMTAVTGAIPEGFLLEQRPQGGASWTTLSPTTAVIADAEPPASPGTLGYELRLTPSWDLMPGTYTLQVTYSVAFTDQTPPAGQVTINAGGAYTQSVSVTLRLATDDSGVVEGICFSNDNVTWSAWQTYSTTAPWTLAAPDGPKTVWAKFRDRAGNEAPPVSASVLLDTAAPTISGVTVSNVTATTADVSWQTSEPASRQVEYDLTASYGLLSTLDPNPLTAHLVVLSGLTPGTLYHFRSLSADPAGNLAVGTDATFSTLLEAPTLSSTLTLDKWGTYTVRLDWTASAAASYRVERKPTTDPVTSFAQLTSTTGLSYAETQSPPFSYDCRVIAVGAGGSVESAPSNVVTAASGPDTTPPVLTSVTASPGQYSCTVTWTTDEPSKSAVSYRTGTDPFAATTTYTSLVTSHSVTVAGLVPGTTYEFYAVSTDSTGNTGQSATQSFTSGGQDPPGNLVAERTGSSHNVVLTWTAAAGATDYRVYWREQTVIGEPWGVWQTIDVAGSATTAYTHSQPDKTHWYEYYVTALGPSGESVPSNSVIMNPAS